MIARHNAAYEISIIDKDVGDMAGMIVLIPGKLKRRNQAQVELRGHKVWKAKECK
jgi:hypothetical protein